ncbi:unnamed protein product [Musa acuminata subsp. burmannicoides]
MPNDLLVKVITSIDLNDVDIVGYLPAELDLLIDVTLLLINSNRFYDIIPQNISSQTPPRARR